MISSNRYVGRLQLAWLDSRSCGVQDKCPCPLLVTPLLSCILSSYKPTSFISWIKCRSWWYFCVVVENSCWNLVFKNKIQALGEGKKTLFYGRTDSKKRSVGHNIFFTFFAKITRKKSWFFSHSLRSKIFIQIVVQKMADFTIFGSKKKIIIIWANGEKRSVGPVKQVFFFLALIQNFQLTIGLKHLWGNPPHTECECPLLP